MRFTKRESSLAVLCLLVLQTSMASAHFNEISAGASVAPKHPSAPDRMSYRIAERLRDRLDAKSIAHPSLQHIENAVLQRQDLLRKSIEVTLYKEGEEYRSLQLSTQAYPHLIKAHITPENMQFSLVPDEVSDLLTWRLLDGIQLPVDAMVYSASASPTGLRAETDQPARAGYLLHLPEATKLVLAALESNQTNVGLHLQYTHGAILNASEIGLGDLSLIASGHSNFTGSSKNRSYNVNKALAEHVHNSLVAPGERFSFNETLNGPVTGARGWKYALVIRDGGRLVEAPGGGICQASTTLYRAILNAGLQVDERRSHSLFVHYYEEYGVGVDATIFPGTQDLAFINNTEDYLLIQAYTEEDEAIVNIYGTDDGREVEMQGPFFAHAAPSDFRYEGRELRNNEIAWKQIISYADGSEEENIVLSRYQHLPWSVKQRYAFDDSGSAS